MTEEKRYALGKANGEIVEDNCVSIDAALGLRELLYERRQYKDVVLYIFKITTRTERIGHL